MRHTDSGFPPSSIPPWVGLLPLALFLGLHPHLTFGSTLSWHDLQRTEQILLFASCALLLTVLQPLRHAWGTVLNAPPRSAHNVLLAIFLLGSLSTLMAEHVTAALLEIAHVVLLLSLAAYVAALLHLQPEYYRRAIPIIVVLAAGLLLAKFVANYALGLFLGQPADINLIVDGYSNIRHFAQFQSWSLPLLLLPLLLPGQFSRWLRVAAFSAAAGWWVLLYLGVPRGTLIGLLAGGVLVAVVFRRQAVTFLRWLLLSAIAGGLAWFLLFLAVPGAFGLGNKTAILATSLGRDIAVTNDRLELWMRAVDLITEHPLLGAGPMHYACTSGQAVYSHPHSFPLQFASEWGLPAAALLALLSGWALYVWLRQCRQLVNAPEHHAETKLRIVLTAALVTAGTHSLVSGVMVMPVSQVMFALVTGFSFALWNQRRERHPVHAMYRWPRYFLPLLALVFVLGVSLPQAFRQTEAVAAYQAKYRAMPYPGYWHQGNICEWPIAWWEAYPSPPVPVSAR
ncbi:MAG: O-antigen ligase family protein [Candidatus Zixiibacteriota bacterium]